MIPTLFHDRDKPEKYLNGIRDAGRIRELLNKYEELDITQKFKKNANKLFFTLFKIANEQDPNSEFRKYTNDRDPFSLHLNTPEGIEYINEVRTKHSQRSCIYILYSCKIQNLRELYKTKEKIQYNFEDDIKNIAAICLLHPFKAYKTLGKLMSNGFLTNNGNNLPLLIAYLRIADTLHIPNKGDEEFLEFIARGPDQIAKFYWFKSRYTKSVFICPDKNLIKIISKIPGIVNDYEIDEWGKKIIPIQKIIKKEIQDEVDAVKDILCKGGISFFSDINTEEFEKDAGLNADYEIRDYELVLKNIELIFNTSETPSSSLITENIVKTIKLLLDSSENSIYLHLQTFNKNILGKVMAERSRQGLLVPIKSRMDKVLMDKSGKYIKDLLDYINNWERVGKDY